MRKIGQKELAELLMDNKENMYRLAYSILKNDADAQDAVGETIVAAFEKRSQLRKPESAKAWIMQILVNKARSIGMRGKRTVLSDDLEQMEAGTVFQYDELWPIVMELREEYREVIVLYYYAQFSVKEIGKALKIPAGTVKSRLSRARETLAKEIR